MLGEGGTEAIAEGTTGTAVMEAMAEVTAEGQDVVTAAVAEGAEGMAAVVEEEEEEEAVTEVVVDARGATVVQVATVWGVGAIVR